MWGRPAADGSRTGTIHIGIGDAPVAMQGGLRMRVDGRGTRIDIDGDLKARVPLVGGRIERAAEPSIRAAIDIEQEVGEKWLAAR